MTASTESLRESLVDWFNAHARALPWRSDPTPYKVLLSEIMLQQTRVETVVPYFERFVARWPRLEDLAAAEPDEVLGMWAGLGYYRRARFLHAAAKAAVALGGLPAEPKALKELPGIGAYTSGAIAAIAFGVPAAAVDGNVERVLSRVYGLEAAPKSTPGRKVLAERALDLAAPGVASQVVQGLMELGATVCTPTSPSCERCPWARPCEARRQGRVHELPRLAKRRKPKPVQGVAGILWREGRVLVGKRPPGLLGGLWEPVALEHAADESARDALSRALQERAGLSLAGSRALGTVTHVFTHRRLTLQVHEVFAVGEPSAGWYEALDWLDPADPVLPLSKLARKVLAHAEAPGLSLPLPLAADRPD